MPRIPAPPIPGIAAFFKVRPETGVPLCQLAEALLRGPSSLTPGERETIAAVVSTANDCVFCARSHAAAAATHTGDAEAVAAQCRDPRAHATSAKMRALFDLALAVRESGKHVTDAHIERAREAGADDVAIHDTVLIAAAFSMFNRYVDGLAATTPNDDATYREMGDAMAKLGYMRKRD